MILGLGIFLFHRVHIQAPVHHLPPIQAASKPHAAAPPAPSAPAPKEAIDPPVAAEDRICSLNVVQGEVAGTLRFLSEQSGINLVLLSVPEKKLTLHLHKVKLGEIVRHVCAASGLSFLKVNDTYVIASDAELKAGYPKEYEVLHPTPPAPPAPVQAPTVFKKYKPKFIGADRLAETLTGMFHSGGLTVVPAGGAALPTGLPADGEMAAPDFHSSGTSGGSGAQSGSAGAPTGGAGGPQTTGGAGSPQTTGGGARTLMLYGDAYTVEQALKVAATLDTPPAQVAIQATIYEISNDALKDLGLSWNFGQLTVTEQPNGINFGTFSRTGLNFDIAINALETNQKAHLLASPNISAIDGTTATLLIGQELNFPDLIGYSNANTPIFGTKQVEAGISLEVAPIVSDDGTITMQIRPKVSTVTGFLQINGASYPQLSSRKAQATIRVHTGETIVLGGLMNSQDIDQIQRVPILGQIPIFGELFKTRHKTRSSSQLIISITPKILPGG